jgi:hypothetical protein
MFRAEDILALLRAKPFEPFRIRLSDGSAFEIRHPELAIVDRNQVIVGVPGPRGPDDPVEQTVMCAIVHITRTENANGKAQPR